MGASFMSRKVISPFEMAELYYNRMHFGALGAVERKLESFEEIPGITPSTLAYWRETRVHVHALIERKQASKPARAWKEREATL